MMLSLASNKAMDQLAMANSVRLYGHVLRSGGWSCVEEGVWSCVEEGGWSCVDEGGWSCVEEGGWSCVEEWRMVVC